VQRIRFILLIMAWLYPAPATQAAALFSCAEMGKGVVEPLAFPAGGEPKAYALVTHGFNLNPRRLSGLVQFLESLGIQVATLTLSGHRGSYEEMEQATFDDWRKDMSCAETWARETRALSSKPVYFIGISLGALAHVEALNRMASTAFTRRVLIVPALKLRWYTYLLVPLTWLPFNIDIPSAAPKEYRLYSSLPTSAYDAVFSLLPHVDRFSALNRDLPALVFAAPDDELVDYEGLRDLIRHEGSASWRFETLDNRKSAVNPHYAHNAVDRASMGDEMWAYFCSRVTEFLAVPPPGKS
jgi:alpha-beta hydrolase superfamily lysophospholipase